MVMQLCKHNGDGAFRNIKAMSKMSKIGRLINGKPMEFRRGPAIHHDRFGPITKNRVVAGGDMHIPPFPIPTFGLKSGL